MELPLALPLIFAGIRTAAVFVVATTTISALAGYSGTLGDVINNETSYHLPACSAQRSASPRSRSRWRRSLAGAQRPADPAGSARSSASSNLLS